MIIETGRWPCLALCHKSVYMCGIRVVSILMGRWFARHPTPHTQQQLALFFLFFFVIDNSAGDVSVLP